MSAPARTADGWWAWCNHKVSDGKACGIRTWIRSGSHQQVPIPRHAGPDGDARHKHREVANA